MWRPLLVISALSGASAFQGAGITGCKPHLLAARSPKTCALRSPARVAYAGTRSLEAQAQGTVLVAAANRPHNGFMHVETPDRVTVMWDLFGSSGLMDQCKVLDVRPATKEELVTVHTRGVSIWYCSLFMMNMMRLLIKNTIYIQNTSRAFSLETLSKMRARTSTGKRVNHPMPRD